MSALVSAFHSIGTDNQLIDAMTMNIQNQQRSLRYWNVVVKNPIVYITANTAAAATDGVYSYNPPALAVQQVILKICFLQKKRG